MARRRLIQTVNRHDGKELLDSPVVRHALKQRKIAEIGIGQHSIQTLELLGEEFKFRRELQNLSANCPKEILRKAALLERKIAQTEEVQRGVERLLSIMIGLE